MSTAVRGTLFGRSAQLEAVGRCLARARHGRREVVFIEGEPGIGKSRLLHEILHDAADTQAFTAGSEPLEQTRPFGPLSDALACVRSSPDLLRAEIAHLIDDGAAEFRVIERVAELIERLGLQSPTIIAVDDLQWADPATVACLRFVTRHLGGVPVAFLLAMRPQPRSDAFARFFEASIREGAEYCSLGPLDVSSLMSLVENRLGAAAGPHLRGLVETVGGNPFYALELIDALAGDRRLHIDAHGSVDTADSTIPAGFRANLVRYLHFLSRAGLTVLRQAAVLGTRFQLADLVAFAGKPAAELLPIVEEAQRAGILAVSGDQVVFRHDLLREAIYEDMPYSVRQSLHLDAGWALAGAGASPDTVAAHLVIGARPGDEVVIEWLIAAGKQANNNLTRAECLIRVIELLPPADRRLPVVGADAIVALNRAGRPTDAEALAERLRPTLGGDGAAQLTVALVVASSERVDPARALAHVEASKPLHSFLTTRLRAELLAHEASAQFLTGNVARSAALAAEAVEAGRTSHAPLAVVIGQMNLSWAAICQGRARDAVPIAEDAVAHRPSDVSLVPEIYLQVALVHEDRFAEAEEVFQAASRRCDLEGRVTAQAVLTLIHALALQLAGRLDEARAEADASHSFCELLASPIVTTASRSIIGRVALHQGGLIDAEEMLRTPSARGLSADWRLWTAGLLQEARGHQRAALDLLKRAWDQRAAMPYFMSWVFIGPDLCRLSVRLGDRAHADEVARAVAAGAAGSTSPSAAGASLRCRGLVDRDPEAMLAAVAAYESGPRVLETARTREEAAEMLANPATLEQLTAALTICEMAGATGDAARVRAALRAKGVRLGTRGPRRRPLSGWASLTPTELHVADLATAGLTSRQIGAELYISSLTVGSHLRSIYRKLDINSRAQLATEATRHRRVSNND